MGGGTKTSENHFVGTLVNSPGNLSEWIYVCLVIDNCRGRLHGIKEHDWLQKEFIIPVVTQCGSSVVETSPFLLSFFPFLLPGSKRFLLYYLILMRKKQASSMILYRMVIQYKATNYSLLSILEDKLIPVYSERTKTKYLHSFFI